jgi:hypothetical protein
VRIKIYVGNIIVIYLSINLTKILINVKINKTKKLNEINESVDRSNNLLSSCSMYNYVNCLVEIMLISLKKRVEKRGVRINREKSCFNMHIETLPISLHVDVFTNYTQHEKKKLS